MLLGDFNAKVGSKFEKEYIKFSTTCHLEISDYSRFGRLSDVFTYVSDAHGTTSWLDHYICSHAADCLLSGFVILDKVPSSDHLPWWLVLIFPGGDHGENMDNKIRDVQSGMVTEISNWSSCNEKDVGVYFNKTQTFLADIDLPVEALLCNDVQCKLLDHKLSLDTLYDNIYQALYKAGVSCIPSTKCTKSSHYIVPAGMKFVRDSHTEARQAYIAWRDSGKPRTGPLHDLMTTTRLRFKYNYRQCLHTEDTARADGLANSLCDKDMSSFWKTIKKMNRKTVP